MFILSSVSSGLELQLVNHNSIYKDTESKDFKNIKVLYEISNNWPNDFLEQMYARLLNFVEIYYWQNYNVLILLQQFLN